MIPPNSKPSDLIRKGWTQGAIARNKNNLSVNSYHDTAVCWCIVGACFATNSGTSKLKEYLNKTDPHFTGIFQWNDFPGRTQQEVIKALEAVGL